MNETLSQIIDWLKQHGRSISVTDEPFMPFHAEWQDWSFMKPELALLYIGYTFVRDGENHHDPLYVFTIEGDQVTSIQYHSWQVGSVESRSNPSAYQFLDWVWERHFAPRDKPN